MKIKVGKNRYEVNIIRKEDLPSENVRICGYVYKKSRSCDDTHKGDCTVTFIDNAGEEITIANVGSRRNKVIGYIQSKVEGEYIGVYRKRPIWIPIVALVLAVLLMLLGVSAIFRLDEPNLKEIADTISSDDKKKPTTPKQEQDSIEFAGYSDVFVSDSDPIVYLNNPKVNDVYFTYTIYNEETGDVVLPETGLIAPGTSYEWYAKESLSAGDAKVRFVVSTYSMDGTQTPYTQGNLNEITVHVQ